MHPTNRKLIPNFLEDHAQQLMAANADEETDVILIVTVRKT